MISFFNTYIDPSVKELVKNIFETTYLSEGKQVKEFEEKLFLQLGIINPVALNSGTSALHLAMILAGVKEGDEVICPAQTFIASALTVLYQKAVPVFADINYNDGNICPESILRKITDKTKVILVVHWGGNPCDMNQINKIANENNLIVIEDAAHAIGAMYCNKPIGSISPLTCFSFQAIKHLTTGDGGALACLSYVDYLKAKQLRWFGIDRDASQSSLLGERQYDISYLGYKYHLNDYAAILGIANLLTFEKRIEKRRYIAEMYFAQLKDVHGLTLFLRKNDRSSSYWLFGLHVEKRNEFILAMNDRGIPVSVVHQRIDRNSIFGGIRSDLPNQEKFDETQIHIPVHDGLSDEDVESIIEAIKKGW